MKLRLVGLVMSVVALMGVAAPEVASAKSTFHMDLYRSGVFVTQYRWTWCVGAASQAMLNISKGTSSKSFARQKTLVTYAMAHDGFPNSSKGGSDAMGWKNTLNRYGAGAYQISMATSYSQAITRAAKRMRATAKPVGLLVMGGRHAWVMSGFDATADPASGDFTVTNVYVMGSLYPKQQKGYFDLPPDTRLTYDQLKTPFHVFDDPDSPQYGGYWVTVSP